MNKIILSLIVFSLFTFSCKNVAPIDTIKSLDAKTLEDSCQSCKEPSEDYLKSRTLRDELVEDIIFADYRLSDEKIDELLIKFALGDDADTDKKVYKKNKETLLSYTLPSITSDDSYQNIVFDESKPDCITVWAFDFYIEDAQGFAIVSNDDRLGGVFYYSLDNINKAEVKAENTIKINEKINQIKQEWSTITSSDIYSVYNRAWGMDEGDVKTRGKSRSGISSSDIVSISASYTQVPFIFKDFVKESDFKYARDVEFEYPNAVYWFLKEAIEYYNYHKSVDNPVIKKNYDEYKKVLDNSNSVTASYARHGYHIINKNKHDLMITFDMMIRNECPAFSYTYYDIGGNKRTIPNVWKHIKSLKPGEPLSDLSKRILQHLTFYVEGGFDRDGSKGVVNDTDIGYGYWFIKDYSPIAAKKSQYRVSDYSLNRSDFNEKMKESFDFDFSKIKVEEGSDKSRGFTFDDVNPSEYLYFSKVVSEDPYRSWTFHMAPYVMDYEFCTLIWQFKLALESNGMAYNKRREYIRDCYQGELKVKKKKKVLGIFPKTEIETISESESEISFNATKDWFVTSGGNFLPLSKSGYKNQYFLIMDGVAGKSKPSVSLPVSMNGKKFVDVIRNGRFELDTESNFKSYKKSNVEKSGDSNATVSEYIIVVPDPESTKGLAEQWRKKNPGKARF